MMLRAVAVLAAALLLQSCTPPRGEQEKLLQAELVRHFNNLNRDAELRKIDLKTPRGGLDGQAPSARQYSDFIWHPEQVIVLKSPMPEKVAVAPGEVAWRPQAVIDPNNIALPSLAGAELHDTLTTKHGAKNALKMYTVEPAAGAKAPAKVTVRYLRRHWVYDATGRIELTEKNRELGDLLTPAPYEAPNLVDIDGRPTAPSLMRDADIRPTQRNYYAGGFHRMEMVYLGEMVVEYAGGMKIVSQSEEPCRYVGAPAAAPGSTSK